MENLLSSLQAELKEIREFATDEAESQETVSITVDCTTVFTIICC